LPVLDDLAGMGVQQLFPERANSLVIEGVLHLKGAVGDPSSAAKKVLHLT
jgi:hypothetical protein